MPLTVEDDYKITIPETVSSNNVFLINGQKYICGIFQLEPCLEKRNSYYLKGNQLFMGELKYFSFEEDITTISFFDGRH